LNAACSQPNIIKLDYPILGQIGESGRIMPGAEAQRDDGPCADEIRAALEHMAGSEAFRGSPQLVSFLRYVVEATLRGDSDRIKGYTIAVEALGRPDDFDPQADPIVRVEAMRLRRALARYYANGGKCDRILIDLPLGSYVPAFRHNPLPEPQGEPGAAAPTAAAPGAGPGAPEQAAQAQPGAPPPARRRFRRLATAAALVLTGGAIYAGLDFWFDFNTPRPTMEVTQSRASELTRPPSAFPVLYIGAFQTVSAAEGVTASQLRGKLRDALARFDELTIVNSAAPESERRAALANDGRSGRYDLSATLEAAGPDTISFAIRLSDVSDDRVIFARAFHQPRGSADNGPIDDTIVREVAVALAQPYGIIHSRERGIQMGTASGDPRYRCLLDSYEYWRTYSVALHAQARDCLERLTTADPSFAAGFSALTEITLQEHRRDLNGRPGDGPSLDRALRHARRAVELKPDSARAYQALMDAHFARGEAALSLEAGRRAVALNPYNPNILATYGARLVALGEIEKGRDYLREAALAGAVRPGWHEFFLFLAAYMLDDRPAAATHAAQIVSEKFALGYLARALVALQAGNLDVARNCFAKLAALQPGWRDEPLERAKRSFPSDAVANRVTRDLAQVAGNLGQ
jgi:tetratricopeptide (TPR) repeat protein